MLLTLILQFLYSLGDDNPSSIYIVEELYARYEYDSETKVAQETVTLVNP